MIISEIKLNNSKYKPYLKNLPVRTQVIKVRCDNCGKEYNSSYIYYENGIKNYGKDLCQSCKQIEQYKQGKREKQKKHIGFYATNYQKGKTYEEMYNEQKIQKLKEILSIKSSGKNNPNYGGKYSKCESCKAKKGETYEIRFGKEKANKMKKNLSNKFSGSKNNMYGKPSPQGSGNGWSGWYKGWFFRSLLELSYMVNIIEKNGWKWENAESKKYKIPYTVDDKKRNYFCDFLINNNQLTEIKPKNLRNSKLVMIKEKAAKKWCEEHNLLYKIICDDEFEKLTDEEIKILYNNGNISFIDRYEEKYNARFKQMEK